MNMQNIFNLLPDDVNKAVVTHSGGMDSSVAIILACEKYGSDNVISLGFDYGQRQIAELQKAKELCDILGVQRHVLDLSILGEITKTRSANIANSNIDVPNYNDIDGDKMPSTYVPWRNGVLFMLTSSFAEVNKADLIISGLQVHDHYGYFDTSKEFVDCFNQILELNKEWSIRLEAPFGHMSKYEEIKVIESLDKLHLLKHTLTCYAPDKNGHSCGICPSCAERLNAFSEAGIQDPIKYVKNGL